MASHENNQEFECYKYQVIVTLNKGKAANC